MRLVGDTNVGPAELGATRWLVRALSILRVAQIAPGAFVLATASSRYDSPTLVFTLLAIEVVWMLALFGTAWRRGWFTRPWMFADIGLQAVVAIVLPRLCDDGRATQWDNWSTGPLVGALLLATLFLGRVALVGATCLLLGSFLIGIWPEIASQLSNALASVSSIAAFTVAGSMVGNRLLTDARDADEASRQAALTEQARARTEARYDERTRQYERLHDTVLSTLEGIARGGLEHATESVRQRCSSDASLVRSLNASVDEITELSPLPVVLAEVAHAVEAFGLKVHQSTDRLPHSLPANVAEAAAGAVREALNNIDKHAGVREAWLTSVGVMGGGVRIRVVDNGIGFDPNQESNGTGVQRSIRARWASVGGRTQIDTSPDGTIVELTWNL